MSVWAAVGGALALVPNIFKHKPFQLWYWNGQRWEAQGDPMSSRQCYRQKAALVRLGMVEAQFTVLRKGIKPPPFFNPPPAKEER